MSFIYLYKFIWIIFHEGWTWEINAHYIFSYILTSPVISKYVRKTYTNFFWKDKMRHGIWVHILLHNFASSSLQDEYYFWHRASNTMKKQQSFILRYWSLKFYCEEIIQTIGLTLWCNMFGVIVVLFLTDKWICEKSKWFDTYARNT